MSKLECFTLAGLVLLVALAVVIVVIVPQQRRQPSSPDTSPAQGETETLVARVVEVLEEGTVELGGGSSQPYQRLLVRVESGSLAGQEIEVEEGTVNIISQERLFHSGDRVFLERAVGPDGDRFYISDFVRAWPLLLIIGLFMTLVVLVGRGKGLRSLGGTLFSLVVIFACIVPQIVAGRDPVLASIAGSILLLTVSNYLIYGWNHRAHAAVAGMVLSLVLTGLLAWLSVGWTRLTGLAADESSYLVFELGPDINLQGLLLGGIIIGSMGALDDVCVGQVSVVFELIDTDPSLEWKMLFRRGFNVGRDHIAAMVNTLVLAYVGASLPLMLAFTIYQEPLWQRINREPIAEEIVRTMVGSIGLILAAPITSLIASFLAHWVVQRKGVQARENQSVSLSALAEGLAISPVSANEMVKKPVKRGLVTYERYKGVTLTAKGQALALAVTRRHRLWEQFLTDVLGLDWDRVHEEACRLEHATSPLVEERLARFLDWPETCPHGHPVPTSEGEIAREAGVPLSEMEPGARGVVLSIPEEPELLQYLGSLGLVTQAEFEVEAVAPLEGSLTVGVGDTQHIVGRKVASRVKVRPL
jgi:uncharacterized membrane protein/Mn-dependent DtxR family transcriptional regulator